MSDSQNVFGSGKAPKGEIQMKNVKFFSAIFLLTLSFCASPARANDPDFTITPPTMKYLMVFHGCSTGCQSPQNHKVFLAQSNDGLNFSIVPGWQPYPGSVPTVFRRANTIYIYNALSDLRTIDVQTGVVHDAGRSSLDTPPAGFEPGGFADPSIAQVQDGRLVLFYLPSQAGGDPASCGSQSSCVREIRYAEEKADSGGTIFQDKGLATSKSLTPPQTFSDPDIFFNGTKWVLLVSEGPSTEAFYADSLESSYTSAGVISSNAGGVPAGFHDQTSGQNWIFTSKDLPSGSVINRSVSSTGLEALTSFTPVITSSIWSQSNLTTIASPSLAVNDPGILCPACSNTHPNIGGNGNPPTPPTPPTPQNPAVGQNPSTPSNPTTAPTPPTPPTPSNPPPAPTPQSSTSPQSSPTPSSQQTVKSPAAQPNPTKKMITITCVKGKLTKKVTAVNPACPSGYKKKS